MVARRREPVLAAPDRDTYYVDVATTILMNLILTMSLRLEMSTGQLNMAHISFLGIGPMPRRSW